MTGLRDNAGHSAAKQNVYTLLRLQCTSSSKLNEAPVGDSRPYSVIIFRYLTREVMVNTVAVSFVLLLIIMSGRFVKYLAEAAAGKLAADVLLTVMMYRLPGFLELILPLGLFIGFLLAYGRLYMDSELTVLSACGLSQRRLVAYSFFPALAVALMVAALSLFISPGGVHRADLIMDAQKNSSQFDHLTPSRFHSSSDGSNVTYAETLSEDRKVMKEVFMAEMRTPSEAQDSVNELTIIVADRGEQVVHPQNGRQYLKLHNGTRYVGNPGELNYQITDFEYYWQLIPVNDVARLKGKRADSLTTAELFQSSQSTDLAALHWRLSLPLLVIVVTLLAIPLSKTNPRQGRYVQMIPAILLYIIYLVLVNAARGAVEEGRVDPLRSIWAVHLLFFMIALLLLAWPTIKLSIKKIRQERETPKHA